MKRIIICAFIMVMLIILGIASYVFTDTAMDRTEKAVSDISLTFEDGNFGETKTLSARLSADWRKYSRCYIFIFDKEHVMELTGAIAKIEAFANDENPEILVECKTAAELIRLYRAKERVTWGNVF